ncbi:LysR family transcriptional regulator [Micromonospora sp. NBRC 101691]|uniref:helix-turn-helix domain-containing protein n=1 Tax=Micromonospora sp. NBRC 101691 TaxID=3032198 RepID=UPI0024A39B2B|nr:LysR family transcriptional regulator [Micromonospora sp. NBRC 101691]GLY23742.1 hypothetical protein Misp04_34740 [Micromonospora sp. NBRC 101691]
MGEQRYDEDPQPEVVTDIDLGAVRAFLAVVDDRYFGEAAARLRMSQQAVSKRIAALERNDLTKRHDQAANNRHANPDNRWLWILR